MNLQVYPKLPNPYPMSPTNTQEGYVGYIYSKSDLRPPHKQEKKTYILNLTLKEPRHPSFVLASIDTTCCYHVQREVWRWALLISPL